MEQELLNYMSYVQHGVNILLMVADFSFNGLVITFEHWPLAIVWGSLYALYHGSLMLIEDAQGLPHDPSYYPLLSGESIALPLVVIGLSAGVVGFYFLTAYTTRRVRNDYSSFQQAEKGKTALGESSPTGHQAHEQDQHEIVRDTSLNII